MLAKLCPEDVEPALRLGDMVGRIQGRGILAAIRFDRHSYILARLEPRLKHRPSPSRFALLFPQINPSPPARRRTTKSGR